MKSIILAAILLCGGQDHHTDATRLTIDDIPDRPILIYPVIPISGRHAESEGVWNMTPSILLCHDGPVSVRRIERALQYWQKLDYSFGPIQHALPGSMDCITGTARDGTITIDIPSQNFQFGTHLGQTKTWRWTATNEIFKARIEIIPAWGDSERILEHEIGHALGWMDMNSNGHIMHRAWASGGYNSTGVRNKQMKEEKK